MPYDFDLFVIGGGSGGVRCGRIAAGHGARVGVAEERFWGGTCVNVGCVPKKLLVQAGEYRAWVEDSHGFGWDTAPGHNDWTRLLAAKDRVVERISGVYGRMLEGAGATIFDARATFIDPHTLEIGGKRVTAERVVIAVGGRAVMPNVPGAEFGIISDAAFHLPELPRRVVILGAGYIAVEFAGIFAGLGAEVDLVYRGPRPLRGFDGDMRDALAEALTTQGVRLHPASTITRVEAAGDARRAVLANGTTIDTDLVFFATGRMPNIKGLGLEAAGVATRSGAIPVDADLATNQPHIYAIGDVTNRMNLTPVATAEGHRLADRLFAHRDRNWNFAQVPTAVFSSPPIATVGLTEDEAVANGPVDIYLQHFTPMRHTMTGRDRKTVLKLVVDQATQRVIGAHMLGDDAPEIMQGIAIAMTAGATKADFDQTVGIHPTAAEEFVTLRTRTRVAGVAQAAE